MARYHEKVLNRPMTVLFLVFSFLIFFMPWNSGERELNWMEGYLAEQAVSLKWGPLPRVEAHGEAIPNAFPLFPMLSGALIHAGLSPETALRLLSLLGLAGVAVLVFLVGRKFGGLAVAAPACAMLLGVVLVIDKTMDGYGNWLFILTVLGAHLSWFYYAAIRGDWNRAWLAGWCGCALGFAQAGGLAPVFFLGPLIFMRRPLGIFRRLKCPGFALGCGIFLLTVILWYLPYHFEGVTPAAVYPRARVLDGWDYGRHLLFFPWELAWRLLPWSLLAWAPFCVALQALDRVPMFSRFLRTLFFVDFFLLWLTPVDDVHDWMILVPPLAVLVGINYEIVVRRYGGFFRKLCNIPVFLLPFVGMGLIFFFLLPPEWWESLWDWRQPLDFLERFGTAVFGIGVGVLLMLTAAMLLRSREKPPLWAYILILTWVPLFCCHAVMFPYRNQAAERREKGEVLLRALEQDGVKPGATVYKYDFNDLFAEGIYMKMRLRKINSLEALPKSEVPVVYLIAPEFPQLPERNWRGLLAAPLENRHRKLYLWKGEWQGKSGRFRRFSAGGGKGTKYE